MDKKRVYLIFITTIFLLTVSVNISAITGEASSSPTNVSVFVLPGSPVIDIFSPENTTYYNTSILLNYSIKNDINFIWYNLDNGSNLSLGNLTENSLILTTTLGTHSLYLYANNSLGESMKSVSFTVSNQEQPPSNPGNSGGSGGGGGGGGGGGTSITAFDLEKNLMEVSLIQGETKTEKIKIKNVGSSKITINIEPFDLENFVLIEENNLTLNPGETKEVEIHFFALQDTLPNVYFGKIVFSSGTFKESVVAVIQLKQKQSLFDVNVGILPNYKTTSPGKKISSLIDLTNIGLRGTAVDVSLSLYLTDDEKNKISEVSEEVLAVKDNLTITRKIQVPNSLKVGTYFLIADLRYNNITASSYDSFNVEAAKSSNIFLILALIILILILSVIIIKVVYVQERKKKKITKKEKAFYKQIVKEEN